jgi:hypothetical protein
MRARVKAKAALEQIEELSRVLEAEEETVEEIREGLAESWRVVEERGV